MKKPKTFTGKVFIGLLIYYILFFLFSFMGAAAIYIVYGITWATPTTVAMYIIIFAAMFIAMKAVGILDKPKKDNKTTK